MARSSRPESQPLSVFLLATLTLWAGCSSAHKKTPELSKLEGRKVALVDVDGPNTSRAVVETALVNQLVMKGSFILVSKQDVEAARRDPALDPTDWKALARKAGADLALRARVLRFEGDTREGYSEEEIHDSQLEEETGNGKTRRLYKTKSLTGEVRIELEFTDLKSGETRTGVAEDRSEVSMDEKTSAARLPPKLRFLEDLSNKAFRKFFEKYE